MADLPNLFSLVFTSSNLDKTVMTEDDNFIKILSTVPAQITGLLNYSYYYYIDVHHFDQIVCKSEDWKPLEPPHAVCQHWLQEEAEIRTEI